MGMMIGGAIITGITTVATAYALGNKYESDYRLYCVISTMLGLSGVIFYMIGGVHG